MVSRTSLDRLPAARLLRAVQVLHAANENRSMGRGRRRPAHLTCGVLGRQLELRPGLHHERRAALSGRIAWQGPLTEASKQSRGSGTIQIVDGYLNQLPVLSTLLAAVNRTMKAAGMSSGRPSDTADMAFTFEGDRVNFHKVDVVTQMAVLRGHGDIFFDTHLNMLFNAGALEKVESMLGRVGAFLGRMTDEISAYTLTGTLGEPKVGVTLAPNL